MTKQTPSSLLLIAALAGGIGFVAFVALMVVGEFTFSPALFLALLAALAAAIFLFQGFHKAEPAGTPDLRPRDSTKFGDVTRMPGTAGVEPGSAGVKPGAASGFATAASPAPGPAPAPAAAPREEAPAHRETPPASEASPPSEATEAARGHSSNATETARGGSDVPASAGTQEPAKWKSTQLAGTQDLAGRKGSWSYEREAAPVPEAPPSEAEVLGDGPDPAVGTEPTRLHAPREGGADDLKRINGVGPKLETLLHGLGIYHFDQVAAWNHDEIAWVDEHLEGFRGRVGRDEWVRQAQELSAGRQE